MTLESNFQTIMEADITLMNILTGGVYTLPELGRDGVTRETIPDAYDDTGWLQPTAVIAARALIPDYRIVDYGIVSTAQVVEIWLYEDTGFTNVDAAAARLFTLFQDYQFEFPLAFAGTYGRFNDEAILSGASVLRQDWRVVAIQGA